MRAWGRGRCFVVSLCLLICVEYLYPHVCDAISGQHLAILLSIGANIARDQKLELRLMFRRWIPGKWTTRVRKFYSAVFENKNSVFWISVVVFFVFKEITLKVSLICHNYKYYALLWIKVIQIIVIVCLCKRKINDWKNDRNNFYANILNRRVRSGVSFLFSLSLSSSLSRFIIQHYDNNMWLTTERKKKTSLICFCGSLRRPCVECLRVTNSAFNFTILSRDFYLIIYLI